MRTPTPLRRVALAAFGLYAGMIALIAFWPTPVDKPVQRPIEHAVAWSNSQGAEVVSYPLVESMANVALFVPVGLVVLLLVGARRWWLAILVGTAMSGGVELAQQLFLSARVSTVDDIWANTAGTTVGTALGVLVLVIFGRTARRQASPPRVG